MSSVEEYDNTMGNSMSYDNANDDNSEDTTPRHTQFLDLTNGEGGSRSGSFAYAEEEDDDDDEEEGDDEDDGGGGGDEPVPLTSEPVRTNVVRPASAKRDTGDAGAAGRVVETGQEHTGRWTREEHAAFLSALKMYGKEWKKVAAKVKTRTVVQTRTHAQKYFQKLQKALNTNETKGGTVDMGVDAKQKALALKKRQQQQQQQKPKPPVRSQSTASTHAAAHLMTNLSSAGGSIPPPPPVSFAQTSSAFASAPYSSAQVPNYGATHGFSSASNNHNDQPLLPPQSLPAYPGGFFGRSGGTGSSMSIVAPEHDFASRMGKFPEPSPAATGKRKLAEIAAAQMLAGVIGGKDGGGGDATPPPPEGLPDLAPKKAGMSLQIVNPETLGVTYEESLKRKRGPGGSSPTTPWDGELEALIRYGHTSNLVFLCRGVCLCHSRHLSC